MDRSTLTDTFSSQFIALPLQEKELAKEMTGLNIVAQTSSSAAGGAGGTADGVKKYNKSSFFDEISCDVLDRAAGAEVGWIFQHERPFTACTPVVGDEGLNAEVFGVLGIFLALVSLLWCRAIMVLSA